MLADGVLMDLGLSLVYCFSGWKGCLGMVNGVWAGRASARLIGTRPISKSSFTQNKLYLQIVIHRCDPPHQVFTIILCRLSYLLGNWMVQVHEGVGHVWEVCSILEEELSEYASFLEVIQLASIVMETTKSVDHLQLIIRELFVLVSWSFAIAEIHLTHLRYADDRCYLDESLFFRIIVV